MFRAVLMIIVSISLSYQAFGGDVDVISNIQAIAATRNHEIHSDKTGFDYHLLVRIPDDYDASQSRRYPAVYLLDGGATYPMLAGYYNYLRHENVVPEAIIVGISYGTDDWRQGNHRGTDYTAPTDQREHWGGAKAFQQALQMEIIPLIEGAYRADSKKRIIFGQSLGGQFVLYTALTEPDLFWGHIASNPALHRNLDFFLETHSAVQSTASRLFVARASEDEAAYRGPGRDWMNFWNQKQVVPLPIKTVEVDGYGHFSLAPESFRRGLIWLFD